MGSKSAMLLIKMVFLSLAINSVSAQAADSTNNEPTEENMNMSEKSFNQGFESLILGDEKNYNAVLKKEGIHNNIKITLFRFQPENNLKLNQQHVSFIQNHSGGLEGFVRLVPQYQDSKSTQHVSKKEAEEISMTFLKQFAPDLLGNSNVNWVDKHTEEIYVNNQKITVAGMKVKCRNEKDGLYFWIVVAPDKSIIIFERDVKWDFLRAGRITEKWLHDSWLTKNL